MKPHHDRWQGVQRILDRIEAHKRNAAAKDIDFKRKFVEAHFDMARRSENIT